MRQKGGVLGGGKRYPQENHAFSNVFQHFFHKLSTGHHAQTSRCPFFAGGFHSCKGYF